MCDSSDCQSCPSSLFPSRPTLFCFHLYIHGVSETLKSHKFSLKLKHFLFRQTYSVCTLFVSVLVFLLNLLQLRSFSILTITAFNCTCSLFNHLPFYCSNIQLLVLCGLKSECSVAFMTASFIHREICVVRLQLKPRCLAHPSHSALC